MSGISPEKKIDLKPLEAPALVLPTTAPKIPDRIEISLGNDKNMGVGDVVQISSKGTNSNNANGATGSGSAPTEFDEADRALQARDLGGVKKAEADVSSMDVESTDEVSNAEAARTDAQDQVDGQQAVTDKSEVKKDTDETNAQTAEKKLVAHRIKTDAKEEVVDGLKETYNKATGARELAETNVTSAQTAVDNAKNALNSAPAEAKPALQAALTAAETHLEEAKAALTTAKKNETAAKTAFAKGESELVEMKKILGNLELAENKATQAAEQSATQYTQAFQQLGQFTNMFAQASANKEQTTQTVDVNKAAKQAELRRFIAEMENGQSGGSNMFGGSLNNLMADNSNGASSGGQNPSSGNGQGQPKTNTGTKGTTDVVSNSANYAQASGNATAPSFNFFMPKKAEKLFD